MNETMNGEMPEQQLAAGTIVQEDCAEKYRPSRQDCLREYEVRLRFLTLGCIIEVGCKSIPFTTIKEGMEALNAYVKDPIGLRKIWEERFAKEE